MSKKIVRGKTKTRRKPRKTCVCRKKIEFLSFGFTQNGKPCYYCAACLPF